MNAQYEKWLTDPFFDDATRAELAAIAGDEKEIEDRFGKELEFGTGGLRGVLGAGLNRMNRYTVRRATQGLADYIVKNGMEKAGVAIAFDSRRMSAEFAEETALCLAANGIPAYVFDALRPTPELSFAVRFLHCAAGVVVTASHNPPEYNGYKVYWADGAQITPPRDAEIIACVRAVPGFSAARTMDKAAAVDAVLYRVIGGEIDGEYLSAVKRQSLHPEIIKKMASGLRIVYTPLHGTGNVPVRRLLRELGFEQVYAVPQQEAPDPEFTTLASPNPEDPRAFTLALKLAQEKNADLVLATDPDADRLGVYVLDERSGEYIPFTGNMSGVLITAYCLKERQRLGLMPENPAVVKTIVTTCMLDAVAQKYGVACFDTLTGFKYIGEMIRRFEETGARRFVFGMEESYGCLCGTHARDKDAVTAVAMLCEAAAFYKEKGMTLWDQMLALYDEFGFFRETLCTVTQKGADGARKIAKTMDALRQTPPDEIAGLKVLETEDYLKGERVKRDGQKMPLALPKSNVLRFLLEGGAWCCIRPSGTEPKIKFYMGVRGDSLPDADEKLERLKKALMALAGEGK